MAEITFEIVRQYLKSHPTDLEKFLMEEVPLEMLERWMIRRTQKAKTTEKTVGSRKTSLSRWKFCVHADKRAMLQELTASLLDAPSEVRVLEELAKCISSAVAADGHVLFLGGSPESLESKGLLRSNEPVAEMASAVAAIRKSLLVTEGSEVNPKWSTLIKANVINLQEGASTALFHPILRSDGSLLGVIQFWRQCEKEPFFEEDDEIINSYLVWGGVAFHYAQLYKSVTTQRKLHEFLLQVARSIFQDMGSINHLVTKILDFAQKLVQADRASLFLVDRTSKELYAAIFDCGSDEGPSAFDKSRKDLRFPIGTGIAGHVAKTGKLLNIPDAYQDERFNRTVDQATGYTTRSILCMPILMPNGSSFDIIGVLQMVNKTTGAFTKDDEKSFEMFAVYCGLALHHAKLFDKIKKSEQKYKVALEVLSYHNTCTEEEVRQVLPIPNTLPEINSFQVNVLAVGEIEKARRTVFMFHDLFNMDKLDGDAIIRFTLTVRKNYRRVPYHNWSHGFAVANSMYALLKRGGDIFRENEKLALFIGALCHDLDHRGKNNKFMIESASPLASMYSTSTMEHHHFNQTIAILQQEGHNFMHKLNREEFREVLRIVKHCILATDLANFFPNTAELSRNLEQKLFDWSNANHRSLVQAISMTASDLSASAKPWDIQLQTVKVIFQEFYEQGDEERRAGREPIPMMDRRRPDQQSASQVEFLSEICIPCYKLLVKVVPGSEPLLEQCQKNFERWLSICNSQHKEDVLGLS